MNSEYGDLQQVIAKMDYYEQSDDGLLQAEAKILRGDVKELSNDLTNGEYIEVMDMIEEDEYGDAFQYLEEGGMSE